MELVELDENGNDTSSVWVIRTIEQARSLLINTKIISPGYAAGCTWGEAVQLLTCRKKRKFASR